MQTFKTDVAVLMLFFNRPDKFQQVFEQVRQARPSHLFLYQTAHEASATCRASWPAAR